ncbi:hypothetical protein P12x_000422 [Tundrisphaera lichenicola]|uniref:hypothetical protein n=1 Tax=Tundrisphaera lichenicola TaxID=2029860 RepID=UPI003EBD34E1
MRLSNLLFIILVLAVAMGIARDEVGRVAVIVFVTGLGTVVVVLGAIMALFQTLGSFGEAQSLLSHLEALGATAVVLLVGSSATLGLLFVGALLVQWAVP